MKCLIFHFTTIFVDLNEVGIIRRTLGIGIKSNFSFGIHQILKTGLILLILPTYRNFVLGFQITFPLFDQAAC